MFQTYVSQPTEVRAIYWDGTDDVLDALTNCGCEYELDGIQLLTIKAGVKGAQGWVPVEVGHYILCSEEPELHFWPVDKAVFERKYEPQIA
jgi:hypothetical protein